MCVWFKHMNRPLHLYVLELLTPYLSSLIEGKHLKNIQVQRNVVQFLKLSKWLAQCMFLPFSAINTLFIKHQDENLFWKAVSQLYLINAGFYNIICQCRVREKFSDLPLTG